MIVDTVIPLLFNYIAVTINAYQVIMRMKMLDIMEK